MNLTPLSAINSEKKFWHGTKIRFYYDNDMFYDYLLAYATWEKGMLLVNVTERDGKKGLVYSGVLPFNTNDRSVDKISFQYTLGDDLQNWYLIED